MYVINLRKNRVKSFLFIFFPLPPQNSLFKFLIISLPFNLTVLNRLPISMVRDEAQKLEAIVLISDGLLIINSRTRWRIAYSDFSQTRFCTKTQAVSRSRSMLFKKFQLRSLWGQSFTRCWPFKLRSIISIEFWRIEIVTAGTHVMSTIHPIKIRLSRLEELMRQGFIVLLFFTMQNTQKQLKVNSNWCAQIQANSRNKWFYSWKKFCFIFVTTIIIALVKSSSRDTGHVDAQIVIDRILQTLFLDIAVHLTTESLIPWFVM